MAFCQPASVSTWWEEISQFFFLHFSMAKSGEYWVLTNYEPANNLLFFLRLLAVYAGVLAFRLGHRLCSNRWQRNKKKLEAFSCFVVIDESSREEHHWDDTNAFALQSSHHLCPPGDIIVTRVSITNSVVTICSELTETPKLRAILYEDNFIEVRSMNLLLSTWKSLFSTLFLLNACKKGSDSRLTLSRIAS